MSQNIREVPTRKTRLFLFILLSRTAWSCIFVEKVKENIETIKTRIDIANIYIAFFCASISLCPHNLLNNNVKGILGGDRGQVKRIHN